MALDMEPDLDVVGQAGSLAEARLMLADTDVAIIDLELPDGDGADLIPDLRAVNPEAVALVLTASLDRRDVARSIAAGAAGVVHKAAALSEIEDAVRRAAAGDVLVPVSEAVELLRFATRQQEEEYPFRLGLERLTPREREVLETLAGGLSDREIAEALDISVETARRHMASLIGKLGVQSRLQALVLAVRYGVVKIS